MRRHKLCGLYSYFLPYLSQLGKEKEKVILIFIITVAHRKPQRRWWQNIPCAAHRINWLMLL